MPPRKRLLSSKEFGEAQNPPVSASRIRQLIMEGRIYPKPRKVGGSHTIEEHSIILDPPERQGLQKFVAKIQRGEFTTSDLEDFLREASYWTKRGAG